MAKTPIMILQELGVKEGFLPTYISTYSQTSKNVNIFMFEVKYKDLSAVGQALNKKEAKQNAAQNMLMLLRESKSTPIIRPVLPLKNINTGTSVLPSSPLLNQALLLEDHKNYIGSLQEFCIENKLIQPEYEISQTTGLAHEKNFTMSCKIGAITEEAVGTTKKQAKQLVAKKMLQRLHNSNALIIPKSQCESKMNDGSEMCDDNMSKEANINTFEELGLRIVNLNVNILQNDIETKYLELTSKKCSAVLSNENLNFQNYHLFFKGFICDKVCDGKEEELTFIYDNIKKFKSSLSNTEKYDTVEIISLEEQILEYITDKLKLNIEKKTISCKNPLLKMVAFKIHTPLPIIQFGANSNLMTAEIIALRNILDTVMIYLK
ncbi:RISC-loading complex subunit tarbp2-like [Vespa crabro]|uniref:RISC-loading complex subunit tarbp2-like n=1 Tax=Vespa crabro TaxID=7445 RepID=UPI001EFFE733|nr:RISC-loading complex subunit tarbp2-like [Vespa crabro]